MKSHLIFLDPVLLYICMNMNVSCSYIHPHRYAKIYVYTQTWKISHIPSYKSAKYHMFLCVSHGSSIWDWHAQHDWMTCATWLNPFEIYGYTQIWVISRIPSHRYAQYHTFHMTEWHARHDSIFFPSDRAQRPKKTWKNRARLQM